ncbi:DUF4355 domain-containing protein [Bacillus paranthracis]|nr:DUF4355 domain-containing protein [Bacillus paranthracis]
MKKALLMNKVIKPAIRLSDVKGGIQFFSEEDPGHEDDPETDPEGDQTPAGGETFTKAQLEERVQAELNRVAGKIRKEEQRKAREMAQKEFGDKSKTEIETLMDEMRQIKLERDEEKKTASRLKMKDFAISKLAEAGFGAGFASNVIAESEEDILKNIETFKANLDSELTKRVKSSLAGESPKGTKGAGGKDVDPARDAFMKAWD